MRLPFLSVLLLVSALLHAQTFSSRVYTEDNGLLQKFIFSIDQDSNGVLVLGTESGVATYNGDHFSLLGSGLAEIQVSSVFADSRGVIWTGHFQSGVSCISHNIASVVDSTAKVQGRINSLTEDAAGTVWGISNGQGLFHINRFSRQIEIAPGTEGISGKVHAYGNRLFIGNENGLQVYETGSDYSVRLVSALPETRSVNVIALCAGQLFGNTVLFAAGESDGIYYYALNENEPEFRGKLTTRELATDATFSVLECDRNNTLWVGTLGNGLTAVRFGPTLLPVFTEHMDESTGLADNNVQSLMIDRENNLWIGTFGSGLVQLPYSVFRYFTTSNGLIRNEANCVVKDAHGVLWIGTDSGLTEFKPGEKARHHDAHSGFADVQVTALAFDTAGILWIGTKTRGIYVMDPVTKQFRNVSGRFGLESRNVSGIAVTANGLIYVGTSDGLYVFNHADTTPAYFTTINGLAHNNITQLHADSVNNVWFASKGSPPYVMNEGRISVINDIANMQSYVINAICEDRGGKRWVSTDGDGVFSFSTGSAHGSRTLETFSMRNGLRSDHCIGAVTDDFGMLWVIHKSGISLKFPDDSFFYSFSAVDNKLFDAMNGNVYSDGAGSVYFCSGNGLIEVMPLTREYLRRDPQVSLAALFIDGSERTLSSSIQLDPGSYNLTFEFNSILLGSNRSTPFYYRILGADTVWRSASGRNIVIPQLSSGTYVLQILPSKHALMKGAVPLAIGIAIDYPFWQKTWFITAMILLVPLIVYGIIRMRTLSLVRMNQRLHVLVAEKTFLLQTEKESVARINVELEQKTKDITDSIRYAKRIQMAILPDIGMLKKNFAESFVFYQPRDIVSGDFYWFAENDTMFFIAVADCTGHGVPGAFMSMISSTLINKVVFDLGHTRPSEILKHLNSEIKVSLHQQDSIDSSHDGVDIALCVIDKENRVLRFSGAGRPLLHVHAQQLEIYKTNRGGLGGVYNKSVPGFDEVVLPLEKGDCFYMYSDGYTDQFGGAHEHKFSSRALRGLVSSISGLSMNEQEKHVSEAFNTWKGNEEQCDDVLVIGFRI